MRRIAGCLSIPRVVLLLVWLLTDYTNAAYLNAGRFWLLALGFVFMPLTALAWGLLVHFGHDTAEWWPVVVIAAVLFDLGLLDRWIRQEKKHKREER